MHGPGFEFGFAVARNLGVITGYRIEVGSTGLGVRGTRPELRARPGVSSYGAGLSAHGIRHGVCRTRLQVVVSCVGRGGGGTVPLLPVVATSTTTDLSTCLGSQVYIVLY